MTTTVEISRPTASFDTFNVSDIRRKYKEEANKRSRPEGSSQFVSLSGAEEDRLRALGRDPWVDHDKLNSKPQPVSNDSEYKFVILGAGFGGLQFAVQLIDSGLATPHDIRFLDAAGGFGGTWYWNRYPGLQCDLESYIYLPLLEETGYVPKHKYSQGAEIREHAERIARHWNLSDSALFRTNVYRMEWDDTTDLWNIEFTETRRPGAGDTSSLQRSFRAQYVYLAGGGLTQPQIPRLPGLSSFQGEMFHTARWNYQVTGGSQDEQTLVGLENKRVAVIGTAATAIGTIPSIAKYAKELFVVQRTPAYVKPRNQYATDPEEFKTTIANRVGWQVERQLNWNRFITNSVLPGEPDLVNDGWTDMPAYSALLGSPSHGVVDATPASLGKLAEEFHALDLPHMNKARARIDQLVQNRDTAEKLKPWYNTFCKRPTFSDEYLQLFNQSHVHLVDTEGKGPSAITERGIVVDGKEIDVDVIIFSTGYSTTGLRGGSPGAKLGVEVLGRNGVSLDDKWKTKGALTLHGYATSGFPNLFFTGASQGTATGNNTMMLNVIAKNVAYILKEATTSGSRSGRPIIEVTPKCEEEHTAEVVKRAAFFTLLGGCTPGYFNGHGDSTRTKDSKAKLKSLQGSIWSEGFQSFVDYVRKWQDGGKLEGLDIRYTDHKS